MENDERLRNWVMLDPGAKAPRLPHDTELLALRARVAQLECENFALAADQCEDGYGDEWGNHCCKRVDKAVAEAELIARKADAASARVAQLEAALGEIAGHPLDAELGDDGPWGSNHDFAESYDQCIHTARAALVREFKQ